MTGQFRRVFHRPEYQIRPVAGPYLTPVSQPQSLGAMAGYPKQRLFRGQAKQGTGHMHHQAQGGQGRGAGVEIAGQRHGDAGRPQGGHWRVAAFPKLVAGAGQQGGDGTGAGQRLDALWIQVFQVVGGQRLELCRQQAATAEAELLGVELDRQAMVSGR